MVRWMSIVRLADELAAECIVCVCVCVTGLDNTRPLIHEHCKRLLVNLLMVYATHSEHHFTVAKLAITHRTINEPSCLNTNTSARPHTGEVTRVMRPHTGDEITQMARPQRPHT